MAGYMQEQMECVNREMKTPRKSKKELPKFENTTREMKNVLMGSPTIGHKQGKNQ